MIDGSEPIEAVPRMRALALRPEIAPASFEPTRMAAEPSTIDDELPGVWT